MKILVFGGTGFIGFHVVERLLLAGHDVTLYHRGASTADPHGDARHVHDAFANLPAHADALRRWKPDVVIDTVPYLDKGGHGIAQLSGAAGRAIVLTSCDVYRAFARLWRSEPVRPIPRR